MSLGTPPWYTVADKSAFPSSSVEEHKGGANFRRIPRAHQQRSSPRPDSREIAKWFGESAADKSDVGRASKGFCFGSGPNKSESEVRHQSRNNTALAAFVLFALTLLCAVALITGSSVVLRIVNATNDPRERPSSALSTFPPLPDVHFVSYALTLVVVVALLIFLFASAVQVWLLLVVVWCYGYLRSRSDYEKATESVFAPHLNGNGVRPAKTSETDF